MAFTIFSIASFCPTTLSLNSSCICNNFIPSVLAIRFTGTPVIMATTVVLSALVIFMNLVVDIAYKIVDPRITLTNKEA